MTGRAPARIGARIRKLRIEKGLSQRELAEPEISGAYLSLVESGQRSPSLEALTHIAARLDVDVDELRTGVPGDLSVNLEVDLQDSRAALHRGELDEARQLVNQVLSSARRHSLERVTARALCVLASIEERQGNIEVARELYDEAVNELGDHPAHLRFEAVVGHARSTRTLGDTRFAAHELEAYLIELEREGINDPTARMRVNAVLVQLYRALGMERKSIDAADQALRFGAHVEDPEQIACMNMNVARSLLDQGRHDDALTALRDAERIYQSLDWPVPVARARVNAGIVALDKNSLDLAYAMFIEAATTLEEHPKERTERGAALNLVGRTERLRGNVEEALVHLQRARKVLPRDDAYERATNRLEMGLCLVNSNPSDAERELREAANIYEAADAKPDMARATLELGRLMMKRGDAEAAAKVMERGLEFTASSGP